MFLTYTLMGMGIFRFLQTLAIYDLASRILYLAITILALAFGVICFYDYILSLRGQGKTKFKLGLPRFIQERTRLILRKEYHSSTPGDLARKIIEVVLTAFALGFFVSLLEGACTGQLYLPTLVFVSQVSEMRIKAFSYIILYNLMFIVPITAIFILVLLGVYSERLSHFYRKHLDAVKLALALVFLGLGLFLLINL
jgi:hypothetical protein